MKKSKLKEIIIEELKNVLESFENTPLNEKYKPNINSKGYKVAQQTIQKLENSVFPKFDIAELYDFRHAITEAFNLNDTVNEKHNCTCNNKTSNVVIENIEISSIEMDVLKSDLNKVLNVNGSVGVNSKNMVQYYTSDDAEYAIYIGQSGGKYYVYVADIYMEKKLTKPAIQNTFQNILMYAKTLAKKYKDKLK